MSDSPIGLDPVAAKGPETPWTRRLILLLRVIAALMMIKGLYHWSAIVGLAGEMKSGFDARSAAWQSATVFFAVIDLVAAIGLWLAAAWGGVVWLTAAISMIAVELLFPQIYGGRVWIVLGELVVILAYVGVAILASRERPE